MNKTIKREQSQTGLSFAEREKFRPQVKLTKLWILAAILTICGTAAFASCTANDDNPSGQAVESRYVPMAPDYSDPTMWITADGDEDGTGADVFYVVSTWEDDWTTADGKVCHYADMDACSHIRPAEGETDTGVTICYNTVKDVKYVLPLIAGSDICINPVNWRTDATPATLNDTITITVSPEHHVLVATNYSASEYPPFLGFLNVGDIHSCEPWLYSECLQRNIKVRAKEWRKSQDDLLQLVNNTIRQMKADGSLRQLHEKYGLVYAY